MSIYKGIKILTGNSNRELVKNIASRLGLDLANCDVTTFSDGEINVEINETVRGAD